MNRRNREIHEQLLQDYSVLMGKAMVFTDGMPNRSESARDLLHDTLIKTLDHFSKGKGKDIPLEELKFWMITVMENTSIDSKKSARNRLETEMPTNTSEADSDAENVKIQRRAAHGKSSATEIDVVDADNELFPHSVSLQVDGESSISINQCWEKLEEEGRKLLLLNLINKKSLTTKQIAKKLKRPLGSMCVLLNRYKKELYQCLKEAI